MVCCPLRPHLIFTCASLKSKFQSPFLRPTEFGLLFTSHFKFKRLHQPKKGKPSSLKVCLTRNLILKRGEMISSWCFSKALHDMSSPNFNFLFLVRTVWNLMITTLYHHLESLCAYFCWNLTSRRGDMVIFVFLWTGFFTRFSISPRILNLVKSSLQKRKDDIFISSAAKFHCLKC